MNSSTPRQGSGGGRRSPPDILSMLRQQDAQAAPLLDELELAEVVAVLDRLLAWLTEVEPRVRRYLTRRAHQGRSNDLDEKMMQDLYWRLDEDPDENRQEGF